MRRRALNVLPYISLCKMKRPLVGPFLADFIFMHKLYKPCPKDAVGEISHYLDHQFMRRRFFKIHQILPLFTPYWAQRGFLHNLVEISSVILEKKSFKERAVITIAHLSLWLRWAKNQNYIFFFNLSSFLNYRIQPNKRIVCLRKHEKGVRIKKSLRKVWKGCTQLFEISKVHFLF